jgi:hypothetical protein
MPSIGGAEIVENKTYGLLHCSCYGLKKKKKTKVAKFEYKGAKDPLDPVCA